MAATAGSDATDGPVLSLINKRLRGLRKKLNRINQMEESIAQGKPINKEQEDFLRSKPSVLASIEELEKLRQPLSSAVSEEISLAIQSHHQDSSPSPSPSPAAASAPALTDDDNINPEAAAASAADAKESGFGDGSAVEDLLFLLYFGSMFDVKSQSDFTTTMLTRAHERGCCLTYDTVTDDSTDLLGEGDLDLISMLGGLVLSKPVNSCFSHKNALQRCIEHAKLWIANSDQIIDPDYNISYAGLKEKLKKIIASDYFTATPVHGVPISVAVQSEGSVEEYHQKDEDIENLPGEGTADSHLSPADELQEIEVEAENSVEDVSSKQEPAKPLAEVDPNQNNQREVESKEQQYGNRRNYQNQRGGRGGGSGNGSRRIYLNGRGGRGGGRGGSGYSNGRSQYYDQPGNYYQRNYYNRGRGGRGGGQHYNNHGSAVQGGHGPANVGVAS